MEPARRGPRMAKLKNAAGEGYSLRVLYDTVMSSYACSTYDSNMRVGILVQLQYFGALRWNLRRRKSDAPRTT